MTSECIYILVSLSTPWYVGVPLGGKVGVLSNSAHQHRPSTADDTVLVPLTHDLGVDPPEENIDLDMANVGLEGTRTSESKSSPSLNPHIEPQDQLGKNCQKILSSLCN